LCDIEPVEVSQEPKVLERECIFRWQLQAFTNLVIEMLGKFFIRASNCKGVNLVQEKDFGTFESGRV